MSQESPEFPYRCPLGNKVCALRRVPPAPCIARCLKNPALNAVPVIPFKRYDLGIEGDSSQMPMAA